MFEDVLKETNICLKETFSVFQFNISLGYGNKSLFTFMKILIIFEFYDAEK